MALALRWSWCAKRAGLHYTRNLHGDGAMPPISVRRVCDKISFYCFPVTFPRAIASQSMPSPMPIIALSAILPGQEADLFVLMTAKEELNTRDGKPYFKVGFRDGGREVAFPIWDDSPWADDCRDDWTPGAFYKVRAVYRETNYGPQLDIRKIREVCDADAADGFDPTMCLPQSRFEPQAMFDELLAIGPRADRPTRRCGRWWSILLETNREAPADAAGRARTIIMPSSAAGWSTC